MPLSAAFFILDWLPSGLQHLILLNRTVHCHELFRAGFFGADVPSHYDVWYLAA